MQKIGGPLHAAQKQRLMQAESQRIQKTAQDQEVGLKEPVAPRTRRAKDGMGGTARRARSFPALFPKNLCPVDEALEQRRGAIKIDGDVQDEAVRVFHPPEQIRNVVPVKDAMPRVCGTIAAADAGMDRVFPQPDAVHGRAA